MDVLQGQVACIRIKQFQRLRIAVETAQFPRLERVLKILGRSLSKGSLRPNTVNRGLPYFFNTTC
jgi:hypothetical protein